MPMKTEIMNARISTKEFHWLRLASLTDAERAEGNVWPSYLLSGIADPSFRDEADFTRRRMLGIGFE